MRAWRSLHSLPGNLIHRFHHACFLQANVLRVHWSASQPKQRVARGHLTVKKKKMMMTQGRARTMARMSEKPRLQLAAVPQRLALHSRRCPVPGSSWVPLRAMCARTPDLSRCVCVCTVQAQQRWCAEAGCRKSPSPVCSAALLQFDTTEHQDLSDRLRAVSVHARKGPFSQRNCLL